MMKMASRLILTIAIAGLAAAGLAACANSILRNASEAGVETVLEGPLPTPTAMRH